MLDDMEQDVGLTSLSGVEKNVYLAAQAMKSNSGWIGTNETNPSAQVYTKNVTANIFQSIKVD